MWAIGHAEVAPDLITMAKSLSNGIPLSAVTGRTEIIDFPGPGLTSSTFTAYPSACAGDFKVMKIFERDRIIEGAAKGKRSWTVVEALSRRHPSIGHLDGLDFYLSIQFVMDRPEQEPATAATDGLTANWCRKESCAFTPATTPTVSALRRRW